jgi:GPH family glycoside/pentoside/hexuronide:cation symporter
MTVQHTPPEDRVPKLHQLAYGVGAFVNNTLAAAIGEMLKVLNLALGVDPAIVGWIGALPRFFDALTDPLMGYLSDHTRSRFGRRRPYILGGAIAAGAIYIALWMFPLGQSETFLFVWFLVGSILFYTAYTVFATPWVALGYELTPDYNERTRLMGVQNFIGQLAYVVSPWFMWITTLAVFRDQVQGAATLAVVIGVGVMCLGVLPAVFLRERYVLPPAIARGPTDPSAARAALFDFIKGLRGTLTSGPFLLLAAATFLVFNGFILISAFQYYVIVYYIFAGDQGLGAQFAGYSGTLGALSTFAVIPIVTAIATRIGKRRAFFVTIAISIVGYSLKWFCYDPANPWLMLLPAPLMAFGLGGLFTLMGSMIADVCDYDELTTRERREGMYGSVYWWVVKLGMAAAIAGGGYLLNATGFDVALGGAQAPATLTWMRAFDAFIPAATSVLAILAVWAYPLTEERARDNRATLEARRGER